MKWNDNQLRAKRRVKVKRNSVPRALLLFLSATFLLSCASTDSPSGTGEKVASAPELPTAAAIHSEGLSTTAADLALESRDDGRLAPVLYPGTDMQVKLPAAQEPFRMVGEDVSLNFEQAPLSEVTHAILSDILGLDYTIDNAISGHVTLRSRTPVPRDELLGILESLLKAHKTLMIRGDDGRYLITGSQLATKLSPGISSSQNITPGYSTIIVPLQYVSASNMAAILKPVASESAFVRIDNTRNLLMLAGTRSQLEGWLEMVSTFDVDLLKGMSVGLFPLENTTVDDMYDALDGLMGGKEGVGADLGSLVRIVPVKRLNSILVVTPRAHFLDQVGVWVERLDTPPDSNFEKRLYVYPVQNTTAERLAKLLTSIYSGGSGGGRYSSGDVAPGMTPETISSDSSSGASSGTSRGSGFSGGFGSTDGSSAMSDVRVVADEENNALMIYSTGKDYKKIEAALHELDVVATQVIIEASIMEVSLTDELEYGVEWTFKNSLGNNYDGVGELFDTASGPTASFPGFAYSVANSAGDISAVLNALSRQSLLNVISTPSVMVLDNQTAYIHVGDQVPTFSEQTTTDGGRITQSVVYRDTGVKLEVTPSVNAGGLVTMDIEQSTTDIGTLDAATQQTTFLERSIKSRVAVRSNESVVLGGLIRENASSGDAGVPFLHKIPVLGSLFGTTTESDRRTELLVIITPRVLYDESALREVSAEMRSQIRHMELIEAPPPR